MFLHSAGQSSKYIDHLFTGETLGHESDIADGRLRGYEFRSLNNIVGDYYVSPRFLEAVAVSSVTTSALQCAICNTALKGHAGDAMLHVIL